MNNNYLYVDKTDFPGDKAIEKVKEVVGLLLSLHYNIYITDEGPGIAIGIEEEDALELGSGRYIFVTEEDERYE